MNEIVISAIEQLWSWFTVSLVIYQFGRVLKHVAILRGWHKAGGWWDVFVRAYPLLAGIACGFIPLPTLNIIDTLPTTFQLVSARCFHFMLAGALSGQVYELKQFAVQWVKRRYGGASSKPAGADVPASDDEAAEGADDEENAA